MDKKSIGELEKKIEKRQLYVHKNMWLLRR